MLAQAGAGLFYSYSSNINYYNMLLQVPVSMVTFVVTDLSMAEQKMVGKQNILLEWSLLTKIQWLWFQIKNA